MTGTRLNQRWSEEEDAILRCGYSRRPLPVLAQQVQRTLAAVHQHAAALGLRRYQDEYTFRDVERGLGVSHHTVRQWYLRGWLRAQPRSAGTGRGQPRYLVTDAAIAHFLHTYPRAWDPRRGWIAPGSRHSAARYPPA